MTLDPSLLPPPPVVRRPLPLRPLAAVALPLAALALAVVLQRLFEGANPPGDALLRWALLASGAGLLLGLAAAAGLGRGRGERAGWALWGLASPALACGLALGAAAGSKPLREAWADRLEGRCRAAGAKVCTLREFRTACAGDRSRLGAPAARACSAGACSLRWEYEGPFRPDDAVGRGARFVCQARAEGAAARAVLVREDRD